MGRQRAETLTTEILDHLTQLSAEIRELKIAVGLVRQENQQLGPVPRIPFEEWTVSDDHNYSDRTVIKCNDFNLIEVLKKEDFPELPHFLSQCNRLFHCLREFVYLFQQFGARQRTNELSAVFWLNGRPIEPTQIREYCEALQILAKCRNEKPPTAPLPEHTTYDLGPVRLQPKRAETVELKFWQHPTSGEYRMSMQQPKGEDGEKFLFIGWVRMPQEDGDKDTAF